MNVNKSNSDQPLPLLSISALSKSYGQQTVLKGLSLQLNHSEIVAITGPSGCGKTTLLNLIAGLDQSDRGTIFFDGQNISQLSEQQRTLLRRQSIGFIFQFFNLIPTLTVLENCLLPIELNKHLDKQKRTSIVDKQLCDAGLADKRQSYPEQLSGGEQQRVAIIRALAHQPKLVLADEPTGNLDQDTADAMGDFLCKHVKNNQCSLLMVTHSLSMARKADRIWRMQNKSLAHQPSLC